MEEAKQPSVPWYTRCAARGGKSQTADDSVEADVVAEERVHLSKESFGEWLKQKKPLWKKSRRERRVLSTSFDRGGGKDKKQRTAVSMDGFVRQAALSRTEKEWQILEVREMSSYDSLTPGKLTGSGEFIVWVMVGSTSLEKMTVSVPRVVYVSTRKEITNTSKEILDFRKVDKHLPYSKSASFVYEVTMPEHFFRSNNWINGLVPVDLNDTMEDVFETMYEAGTPLSTRILTELGSIVRLSPSGAQSGTNKKAYSLTDLARIDRPSEGEYLHKQLSYKRVFLYVRINPKTKTGIVAVFSINGGSGSFGNGSEAFDVTRPSDGKSCF